MGRGRWVALVAAGTLAVGGAGLAACSSDSSSGSASGTGSSSSTPASSGGSGGVKSVDLTITGDRPATIKGTKGTCDITNNPKVPASYLFEATDYPSLGSDGSFNVVGPQEGTATTPTLEPGIKAIIGGGGFLDLGSGITVSSDSKKVTLDADISGSTGGTMADPGAPLRGHVTGTIVCE